jgi:hypothetical protein
MVHLSQKSAVSGVIWKIPVKFDSLVTRNMNKCEDELLVGDKYEEHQPYLEKSENSEDKKVASEREEVIQCAICDKAAEWICSGCHVTCYCSAE